MRWQQQLELKEAGIDTGAYRRAKRQEYAKKRNQTLYDRKQREFNRLTVLSPKGRGLHIIDQMARISNHVQAA
jgi:hypothetical protein